MLIEGGAVSAPLFGGAPAGETTALMTFRSDVFSAAPLFNGNVVVLKNDLLIRERSRAGRARYLQDYCAGRVGKAVTSRSGKNLPPHRPKDLFLAGWSINQLFAGYPFLPATLYCYQDFRYPS
jgi:hypothetical protein